MIIILYQGQLKGNDYIYSDIYIEFQVIGGKSLTIPGATLWGFVTPLHDLLLQAGCWGCCSSHDLEFGWGLFRSRVYLMTSLIGGIFKKGYK